MHIYIYINMHTHIHILVSTYLPVIKICAKLPSSGCFCGHEINSGFTVVDLWLYCFVLACAAKISYVS